MLPASCTLPPASAYATEQRLLCSYYRLLYDLSTDVEALMMRLWGTLTNKQMYGDSATDGKIDQLDHHVPDLIKLLKPKEQPAVLSLLSAGDLLGTIRYVLSQRGTFRQREDDSNLKLSDNARVAGLGRISIENYGRLHPRRTLFDLPAPKVQTAPILRPKAKRKRRAAPWLQLSLFPLAA